MNWLTISNIGLIVVNVVLIAVLLVGSRRSKTKQVRFVPKQTKQSKEARSFEIKRK